MDFCIEYALANNTKKEVQASEEKSIKKAKGISAEKCPKCKKGSILKGGAAYGCSDYKNGCDLIIPFSFMEKIISENQFIRLLKKGCTVNLKGFKKENSEVEGLVRFDENFKLKLEEKPSSKTNNQTQAPEKITCPKCKKGMILKGRSAYGCSEYKNGCDFIFSFDDIRKKANGQTLSKELVIKILNGN